MANYQIISTGSPLVPHNLQVSFPMNVQCQYVQNVQSNKQGTELDAQFQSYANDMEYSLKNNPDFSTIDTSSNATCTLEVDNNTPPAEPGYTAYFATVRFTIQNAHVTIDRQVTTDLTGQEKDTFLQDFANGVESQYKADRNWIDL